MLPKAQQFLNPVTVTSVSLSRSTGRSGLMGLVGHNSSQMKATLRALDDYHKCKSKFAESNLQLALSLWRVHSPKEFKNRDLLSGGMCSKLAIELGVAEFQDNTIPSVRLLGEARPKATTRHVPKTEISKMNIVDRMVDLHQASSGKLGLVLIDVQSDGLGVGLNVKWDGVTTVKTNMVATLEKAVLLNLPIIEFWVGREKVIPGTLPDIRRIIMQSKSLTSSHKPAFNCFDGTNFAAWLTDHQLTDVVVMGYDANTCVGSTIFGTNSVVTAEGVKYQPGILDLGVNVISSRGILASGTLPLLASEGWPYFGSCTKI